jgi:hypothetical protein
MSERTSDLKEIKAFANHIHSLGKHWQGKVFSWQAEYNSESDQTLLDSSMTFTPVAISIGESGIRFSWQQIKHKERH